MSRRRRRGGSERAPLTGRLGAGRGHSSAKLRAYTVPLNSGSGGPLWTSNEVRCALQGRAGARQHASALDLLAQEPLGNGARRRTRGKRSRSRFWLTQASTACTTRPCLPRRPTWQTAPGTAQRRWRARWTPCTTRASALRPPSGYTTTLRAAVADRASCRCAAVRHPCADPPQTFKVDSHALRQQHPRGRLAVHAAVPGRGGGGRQILPLPRRL